jgi:hypothetical protein
LGERVLLAAYLAANAAVVLPAFGVNKSVSMRIVLVFLLGLALAGTASAKPIDSDP